ncbi:MAG: (d)CMP kinase [Syntrophobacter sp.]
MIIAIDGPAGAGKSTVCRILAQRLRFLYLDTGAMYRALAWALLGEKRDQTESEVAARLPLIPLQFSIREARLEIRVNGRALDEEIRNPEISDEASRISRMEPVRSFLLSWQRKLAEQGDIVAEGRDTATVVFPAAELKVFLTADLSARINRRLAEYTQKGMNITHEEMEKQIRERDEADAGRKLAPMKAARGSLILDTSRLNISEVVERLVEEARKVEICTRDSSAVNASSDRNRG